MSFLLGYAVLGAFLAGAIAAGVLTEPGLRWSGGVDVYGARLPAGCDGTRRLADPLVVLAGSNGLGDAEAVEQVLPVVRRLVEQGLLVG